MSNGSGIEIAGRILEAATGDVYAADDSRRGHYGNINDNEEIYITRAKLSHEVFLSSAQLQEYLIILTVFKLLKYDLVNHGFRTTEKGRKFLEFYHKIYNVRNEEE